MCSFCSSASVLQEIVVGSNMDKIYIVMNYVEHDLKSLMETMKQPFLPGTVPWNSQSWRSGRHRWPQMALSCLWAVPCVALECPVFLGTEFFCSFCKTWHKLKCWLILVVINPVCVFGVELFRGEIGEFLLCWTGKEHWALILATFYKRQEFLSIIWMNSSCPNEFCCSVTHLYCAFHLALLSAPFPILQTTKAQIEGKFIYFFQCILGFFLSFQGKWRLWWFSYCEGSNTSTTTGSSTETWKLPTCCSAIKAF